MKRTLILNIFILISIHFTIAQNIENKEKAALSSLNSILKKADITIEIMLKKSNDLGKSTSIKQFEKRSKEIDSLFTVCGIYSDNRFNTTLLKNSLSSGLEKDTSSQLFQLYDFYASWEKNPKMFNEVSPTLMLASLKYLFDTESMKKTLYKAHYFIISSAVRMNFNQYAHEQRQKQKENKTKHQEEEVIMIVDNDIEIEESFDFYSEDKQQEIKIYYYVDKMPKYPFGESELKEYIKKSINYTKLPKINETIKVFVRVIVNEDGSLTEPTILREVNKEFSDEAIRIINTLPKFIPGKKGDESVKVYYNFQVYFEPN